ncbi:salicylate hydroxylase [Dendrothele bispora CBS 962.96]|uniref:Salicylate hydroxylase n=1 Tax=Dendrothele bispora (strain CBS 962.96) TaxID=1314807 RepID=A0A4S8M6Y9_DENBC|nr:salicylate hydroxylase [Dendrothele bispora CBS 962.96]
MSSGSRLRVAICGAGIAGLTCALALSRHPDIEIDIFESAGKLAEVGAGIGLFPRPWQIIRELGLEQDLLKTTESRLLEGPVPSFRYRKSDQREGLEFYRLITQGALIFLHRADYQQTLLRHLPPTCRTHCSKRLRSYIQRPSGGGTELFFEDGTSHVCDVLIGADGLKSAVRKTMLNEKADKAKAQGKWKESAELLGSVDPVWSGCNAYRTLIPAERLKARAPMHSVLTEPMQYLGKNGYVIAYPISRGKMINFVAFDMRHDLENTRFNGPWVCASDKSKFASRFSGWEPEVQTLLDCVENPLQWAIHTIPPMRSFVSGRVAVMGDAAHAMTPHEGSGAGQAIEDAYLLATVLGHHRANRNNVHRALAIYDDIRRPAAYHVMEHSRKNGQYFTLHVDGVDFNNSGKPKEQWDNLQRLGRTFEKNWEWGEFVGFFPRCVTGSFWRGLVN